MLDNETKRRIDEARDILVGKLPDPKSQVEQITIALIYKFMYDMDKEALEFGGKATFFTGEWEKYNWIKIFDPQIGGHEMLNLYGEAIVQLNLNPNIPQLFRDIFKNAYLPYREPETLKLFLKTINGFHYDHSERLGDAFEYLLSVLGSQGEAGQFRTPRHIIDFIVAVLQPKKNETICDPACGTAGFLISSYKYILDQNTKKNKGDQLTPDDKKKMMQRFVGYDISPDMVRLSLVNMYLHNFTTPKIYEYDTLTSEDRWNESFDIIMANPPFMSPKGGIKPHKKFTMQANRSEVLFVDYIAEHINPATGRAGVIVPEGIIFQGANAYKQLRQSLVDKKYLYAVVSLPAGIFQPYSGVKTSILLMDKTLAKKCDNILFVKIDNDGFDLGAQRRAIDKNDLTAGLIHLQEYKEAILNSTDFISDNKNVFVVDKKVIKGNGDYNLSVDRYRINDNVKQSIFEMVKLGEVAEVISGQSPESEFYNDKKEGMPFYQGRTEFGELFIGEPKTWTTKITRTAIKDDILMSVRAPVGPVNIATQQICIGRGVAAIRPTNKILRTYLFTYLKSAQDKIKGNGGAVFDSINRDQILDLQLPLPPLSIQQQIVDKIESYQAIINGAKQVVQNYKPQIDIDPDWEIVELGEVATFKNGINFTKESEGITVKILGVSDFKNNIYAPSQSFSSVQIDGNLNDSYKLKKGDIIFVRSNGNQDLIGRCVLIDNLNFDATFSGFTIRLRFNSNAFDSKFYTYLFKSDDLRKKLIDSGTGANIKSLNQTALNNLEIPTPSLSIQQQIVSRIEREQQLVNANKELIKIYEQKIKDEINKLWQPAAKEYEVEEETVSVAAK